MGLHTITLKLHKPGKGKMEILDKALLNYNKAFEFLLEKAFDDAEEISGKYRGNLGSCNSKVLSKWAGKDISRELNKFDVQPFKDSLKLELGMTLASYLELREVMDNTGFPKGNRVRPIYFCRYDIKRSYSLLYNAENNRYYCKLYLMNLSNARPVNDQGCKRGRLRYLYKGYPLFEGEMKKATYIILPLSFGKYQEKFLKEALEKPNILRTAKLIKKGKDYYLAVSIETGKPAAADTGTYLGIARSLKNQLNYTIVDNSGEIRESGPIAYQTAVSDNKNYIQMNELHRLANAITALAEKYNSQVILQNLSKKSDCIDWVDTDETHYQPTFSGRVYMQLVKLLEYKLPEKNLPRPVQVSPAGIFYTCNSCSSNSKHNRLNKDTFLCTQCGETMDIDRLGSLNTARKLITYGRTRIKVKVLKIEDGIWFKNNLLGLNLFVPSGEDYIMKLKDELNEILSGMKSSIKDVNNRKKPKIASIIRKFEGVKDLMDLIELV